LLALMQQDVADFTNTFANLASPNAQDQFTDRDVFGAWSARWQARGYDADIMAAANPVIIPRNHQVEAAIVAGTDGDFAPFHALLAAVTQPFAPVTDATAAFARAPAMDERITQTFCGT
jgi:uncharacterized protein YdiU (UPF0061 family)